ncbi:hypothetical protein IWX49DRAFT_549718 [Phyllosticta citricarpa]|uniref:Secreted protein n=1 Tax=Phyllosticta citricarpa TaxID=55181 RepID=A0ABR1MPS2_9PEZI
MAWTPVVGLLANPPLFAVVRVTTGKTEELGTAHGKCFSCRPEVVMMRECVVFLRGRKAVNQGQSLNQKNLSVWLKRRATKEPQHACDAIPKTIINDPNSKRKTLFRERSCCSWTSETGSILGTNKLGKADHVLHQRLLGNVQRTPPARVSHKFLV